MFTSAIDFIGRELEITFLREWLTVGDSPSIIYIHDALEDSEKKGGIGKTWLLRKFYELVEQQNNAIPVMIDFFNVVDRDSIVVAEHVVQAVRKRYPHWMAENFEKLLLQYYIAV